MCQVVLDALMHIALVSISTGGFLYVEFEDWIDWQVRKIEDSKERLRKELNEAAKERLRKETRSASSSVTPVDAAGSSVQVQA
jgi:hypothetical protein